MSKFWVRLLIGFLITVFAAYYQRTTGPTYPYDGERKIENYNVAYKLLRTYEGSGNQPVEIKMPDREIKGTVVFRRYKVAEPWSGIEMIREEDKLTGSLPHQPPAGKLEYFILLQKNLDLYSIPEDRIIITRFKGEVPDWALIPHIFFMFLAMWLSTVTGFEALTNSKRMYSLTLWTAGCLFLGGMILGPIIQNFAFGDYWTGIPFGTDLTDNKTLIAMIFWLIPVIMNKKDKPAREWIIVAALVLLVVFSIPHSMFGSELNYETMQVGQGN